MAENKQIDDFSPSLVQDATIFHVKSTKIVEEGNREDSAVTGLSLYNYVVGKLPEEPSTGSLPPRAPLKAGDKVRIENDIDGGESHTTLSDIVKFVGNILYPVGTIIENYSNPANPSTYLGFGSWVAESQGRTRVGVGKGVDSNAVERTFSAGETTGAYRVKLAATEMPPHKHPMFSGGRNKEISPQLTAGQEEFVAWDVDGRWNECWIPLKGTGTGSPVNFYGRTGLAGGTSLTEWESHENMQPSLAVYTWRRVN